MIYRFKSISRAVLVLGVSMLAVSGCAAAQPVDKAEASHDVDALMEEAGYGLTAEQKADGFSYVGDGVAVRWANASEKAGTKCPSYAESCYIVTIQTNVDCSSGIYIELQLKNAAGTIIGKANEITPGMRTNDKGVFVVTTSIDAPKASLADVHCMG